MSIQASVNAYLDEQLNDPSNVNTNTLEELLEQELRKEETLQQQFQETKNKANYTLEHSLQKILSDKSSLDHLYVALTATKNELTQVRKDHQLNKELHSDYDKFIHTIGDLEQRMRILDSATSYIKTLYVASHLWTESLKNVDSSPSKAVEKYIQLLKFVRLICTQEPVQQGSFVDLGIYLDKCQMELWNKLNIAFTKDFESALKTLDWPNALQPPYGPQTKTKLETLENTFRNLLILGKPTEWNQSPDQPTQSTILSPIRLLLDPISLRFKFHFEGSRPTNRMDKPEWYLKHIKNQITAHIPFIMTTIQPIVDNVFNQQQQQQRVSAKDYFIDGLLVDVTRKVNRTIPKLITQPNLLSHTIHELLQFDQSLRNDFGFVSPEINQGKSSQMSDIILTNQIWVEAWSDAERRFAQVRYDDIVSDNQAFDLYEEDQYMEAEERTSVEATQSSMKLIHLWEGITDTYRLVPSTRQKFHFFAYIQLSLLGQYQYRISSAVDSFEALSLIRSVQVPGALPDSVTGVITATESGGSISVLKKLFRWWASAQKLMEAIRDWEDDEFFLDLNQEITQEPEIAKDVRKNLFAQDKVCNVVDPTLDQQHRGLFGDIYTSYQQLADRIQKICEKLVIKEWTVDTKQYTKRDIWWQTNDATATPPEVSDSLYRPLQSLLVSCKYLCNTYPQSNFLSMYKHISLGIEDWYWRTIITKNQFSPSGVQQLETDLRSGLWKIGKRVVNKPENYTRRLKEALQVFTLPMSSSTPEPQFSCDQLMKSLVDPDQCTQTQDILETLGIDTLTNSEIRDVLRRRNDMLNSWS